MGWESKELPWVKLWSDWYDSASHATFGVDEHALGVYMMSLANRYGRKPDGSGEVLTAEGVPVPVNFLGRKFDIPVVRVEAAIKRLVSVGTLVRAPSGALAFPKLRGYQEDRSTERKRRAREKEVVPGEFPREKTGETDLSRREFPHQRIRGSEDQRSDPDPPYPPRGGESRSGLEGEPPEATEPPGAQPASGEAYDGPPYVPQPRLALVPPEGPEPHRLTRYVEAWNRGRDGSRVAGAAPAGKGAEKRDERWAKALGQYPDPADWEWCARALAASPHHRGDNDSGWIADLEWLLSRGKGSKLEEWIRKGRGMRAGTWAPPAPARPRNAPNTAEARVAWESVLKLAARGVFRSGQPPELDERTAQALKACGGGLRVATSPPEKLAELRTRFLESFGSGGARRVS